MIAGEKIKCIIDSQAHERQCISRRHELTALGELVAVARQRGLGEGERLEGADRRPDVEHDGGHVEGHVEPGERLGVGRDAGEGGGDAAGVGEGLEGDEGRRVVDDAHAVEYQRAARRCEQHTNDGQRNDCRRSAEHSNSLIAHHVSTSTSTKENNRFDAPYSHAVEDQVIAFLDVFLGGRNDLVACVVEGSENVGELVHGDGVW